MCHKTVSSDRQNRRFHLLAHSASGLTIARRCINNRTDNVGQSAAHEIACCLPLQNPGFLAVG
jgi:hypothetical protein